MYVCVCMCVCVCVCVCVYVFVCVHVFSHVWLFAALWNVACQASLSKEFFRQEYLSVLPFPPSKGVCVHVCCIFLSIPLLIDSFVASVYLLLWMVLQWTLGAFSEHLSPDICTGVGLLDHMVVVFLVFKWTFILFSIVAVPIYIPTDTSLSFTSSSAFIVCRVFDYGHSDWCEVITHCSFSIHFSNNWGWASFHVLLGHLHNFIGEISVILFCPFLDWVDFLYWVAWAVCVFGDEYVVGCFVCNWRYFLSFWELSFNFS